MSKVDIAACGYPKPHQRRADAAAWQSLRVERRQGGCWKSSHAAPLSKDLKAENE